jgi:hypothetical protein
MREFISSLESRTLLSVLPITKSSIIADKATLAADVAALKANLALLVKNNTVETDAIVKDFKGLPKADQALLKTLATDELKAKAIFTREIAILTTPGTAQANKAEAIANSLLTRATVRSLATATVDITKLENVAAVPLATLAASLASTTVSDAREDILTALPNEAVLDADVETEQTNATAEKAAIGTAAGQFAADIFNLATDLTSVHTAVGTFPNVVGVFTGTATETAGKHRGETVAATLDITSESSDGILEGTVTDITSGLADPLVGSVSLNGVIILKSTPRTGSVRISGTFNTDAITGKVAFTGASGTFSVLEASA